MRDKMLRRAALVLSILLLAAGTAGCQLAKEGAVAAGGDRLAGVFVTLKPVNLFDLKDYLESHSSSLPGGEVSRRELEEHSEKLYAARTGGDSNPGFVFEGLEGYGLYSLELPNEQGESDTLFTQQGGGLSGTRCSFTDGGATLEGTLYAAADSWFEFYLNPVYQDGEGNLYLTSGQGVSCDGFGAGGALAQTLTESYTVTEGGKSVTQTTSITIRAEGAEVPERMALLHMGRENNILRREELDPSHIPSPITPAPGTDYLLLESVSRDSAGEERRTRTLAGREDRYLEALVPLGNGILAKKTLEILWGE